MDGFAGAVEALYLTAYGPDPFEISPDPVTGELPFSTDCVATQTTSYLAVFTDVSVYATEALQMNLCDLSVGDVLESSGFGFSATDFSFSGPSTYQVLLYPFAERCGGAEEGYVSVPAVELNGVTTWLVPLASILAPAQ